MTIYEWAQRWNIPQQAFEEFLNIVAPLNNSNHLDKIDEVAIQNAVRIEATKKDARLWKNTSGAAYTQTGNFIRFGLGNDSEKINKVLKSSDLIGIRKIKITHAHVGEYLGQFICREIKNSKWKYSDTQHEQAQLNWINFINAMGGDACFACNTGTIV